MRIACIGDVHGVTRWQEVKDLSVDHVVFVGDYVDSHELSDQDIFDNLVEILSFKTEHETEVSLLLGNHDIHYRYYPKFRSTGFRQSMQPQLTKLFEENAPLFEVAVNFRDFVFTHAGLTRAWAMKATDRILPPRDLTELLNSRPGNENSLSQLAMVGLMRGGPHDCGGPFWCDYHLELVHDPYPGINQVVGHTRTNFLIQENIGDQLLINVNYLAYSDHPIFILET